MAARSEVKAAKSVEGIKSRGPDSKGQLIYLHLDLDDLVTIKSTAETFLAENDRLDVLWNNAGVMVPPQGSKTKQGYEKQLGTNNVASFFSPRSYTLSYKDGEYSRERQCSRCLGLVERGRDLFPQRWR